MSPVFGEESVDLSRAFHGRGVPRPLHQERYPMKRLLLIGSLAILLVLPLWAQEKTKTEPKKTAEPKTTEPKTEPKKTESKTTEPKKGEKEPSKEKEKPSGPQMQIEVYNL